VSTEFSKGDKVQWESSQGTIEGTVEKKLTEPMDIKKHHVDASKEDPQYLVKSDKTGKEAAHKPESLSERED
jgi:Hypervirulence associated proteins TUDOR domain